MSGSTTELNLATAVDGDDNADYLTLNLANSLRTLDGLFNNVTGHNHGAAHQGGPISNLPASAIPDGAITSAKIADGTITAADMAAGAAAGNVGPLGGVLTGTLPNPGFAANPTIPGNVTLGGSSLYFNSSANFYIGDNGSAIAVAGRGNFRSVGGSILADGSFAGQGIGATYCFTAPNAAANYGQGYANAWIAASSVDFKKNLTPLRNPLGILLNPELNGFEYDHDWELPEITLEDPVPGPDGTTTSHVVREALGGTAHNIGFVADHWLPHVPEVVAVDKDGKAEGMDYARVTVILWEALKEYITSTNARLDALEARGTAA